VLKIGADDDKISWLQAECKKMVDNGKLTASEKSEVLDQLTRNISTSTEEIDKATAAGDPPKKMEKMNEKKTALLERKKAVAAINPITYRLRHSDEIQKLQMQLCALLALEEKGRSCSLTLADLKQLETKSTLEEQIAALQASSRGWFLTDVEFQTMADMDVNEGKTKYAAKVKKQQGGSGAKKPAAQGSSAGTSKAASAAGGGKYTPANANAWATIGVKKAVPQPSSKKAGGGKGGFAAAFGGDSDEDD
jgi:polyhydroxyalkanoate synthesis regulator phasin